MTTNNKIKINKKKYNGYSNRDTWVVIMWLLNTDKNYNKIVKLKSWSIENFTVNTLQRHFVYTYEQIDWGNVNLEEVKSVIKEHLESIEENKEWKQLV